jgi:hypothetical protein
MRARPLALTAFLGEAMEKFKALPPDQQSPAAEPPAAQP